MTEKINGHTPTCAKCGGFAACWCATPVAAQEREPRLSDAVVEAVQALPTLEITGNAGKSSGLYVRRTDAVLAIRAALTANAGGGR